MRISPLHCSVSFFLALFCVGLHSTVNGEFTAASKSRATKPPKVLKAKTLAPLLKSPLEALWDKGMAMVTPESLEDDEVVSTIAKFVKRESKSENFSPAIARAITLLGEATQPEATEQLASLLGAKDYRIVMFTADAVSSSSNRSPDLIEPLKKLVKRNDYSEHYGFRRCVIDALSRFRDKSTVGFLIEQMGNSDGQLKYEIAMSLQRTTGKTFGGKADDWSQWWEKNQKAFEFPPPERSPGVLLSVPPKEIPWDEPRPSFYGKTLYAKRVVFIIDRSGSMRSDIGGATRLERAQFEIQKAISALSESDSFNVVAFSSGMDVFQQRLVPATQLNKAAGIEFSRSLTPRGETACYEPLKMALEASNDLELILFVSDGEPNAGALSEPNAIVTAITNHNLTQRTTIDAIGIDAHGVHLDFLKNLAEKNAGKLLLVK